MTRKLNKVEIKEKFGAMGYNTDFNIKILRQRATEVNVPLYETKSKIIPGYVGNPKGAAQIACTRGFINTDGMLPKVFQEGEWGQMVGGDYGTLSCGVVGYMYRYICWYQNTNYTNIYDGTTNIYTGTYCYNIYILVLPVYILVFILPIWRK